MNENRAEEKKFESLLTAKMNRDRKLTSYVHRKLFFVLLIFLFLDGFAFSGAGGNDQLVTESIFSRL